MSEIIKPIIFEYVEITEKAVPGIRPGYYINALCNVYNSVNHRYKNPYIDSDGRYMSLEFIKMDGSRVQIKAHRLLMLVFRYFPGCELLEVNHKDGNKHNNSLYNLEWTTHKENMIHAKNTGLIGHPGSAKLNENQVHEICKILETSRYKNQFAEIASEYNVKPITILEIAYGMTWADISSQYNIDYNNKLNNRFTENQVHSICEIIQKYGYFDDNVYQCILETLDLENSRSLKTRIRRIYERNPGYFYYISSKYNW
jgi:hypothetical protein